MYNCHMKEIYEKYYEFLTEWNEKINLTTITQKDEVYKKHFLDSILIKDEFKSGARVLDIGSGAGFPAVPLKIEREDLNFTLIDSVGKKVDFLNNLIAHLELKNIVAIKSRIEEHKVFDYDYVTSRAVAPLCVLVEYCLPFLKEGGVMVAYKSVNCDEELQEAKKAIELLGGKVDKIEEKSLDEETKRRFIFIKKIKPSPKGYPRGQNKPRLKSIK
ncbi:MAG: 16S rRNA (guanine(527)-N(7))-methyltransferase RsmG [Clostridia bacterium]|nr:16S rRNA (guanine(527)-N(7))-methyltransferase RsmG [Clostridia bacterium]